MRGCIWKRERERDRCVCKSIEPGLLCLCWVRSKLATGLQAQCVSGSVVRCERQSVRHSVAVRPSGQLGVRLRLAHPHGALSNHGVGRVAGAENAGQRVELGRGR